MTPISLADAGEWGAHPCANPPPLRLASLPTAPWRWSLRPRRLLTHLMVSADVCEGAALLPVIERMLADPSVAYIHLHNAKRGCYSCRVDRVA